MRVPFRFHRLPWSKKGPAKEHKSTIFFPLPHEKVQYKRCSNRIPCPLTKKQSKVLPGSYSYYFKSEGNWEIEVDLTLRCRNTIVIIVLFRVIFVFLL